MKCNKNKHDHFYHYVTKEDKKQLRKQVKNTKIFREKHVSGSLTQEKFDNIIKVVFNQIVLIEFILPDKKNKKI